LSSKKAAGQKLIYYFSYPLTFALNNLNMKKLIYLFLVVEFAFSSLSVKADEGMWLPMLLGKNYDDMVKHGLKLTPQQLYDVNNASMKREINASVPPP
jgi:hypothetical protein